MLVKNFKKLIVAILVSLVISIPLFAQSLESLLEQALSTSESVKTLELNKQQSLLTVDLNNVKKDISYSFSPYVTVDRDNSVNIYSLSSLGESLLSITIPGSYEASKDNTIVDDTNIDLSADTTVINDSSNKLYYNVNPKISINHNFLFGEYDTIEKDLKEEVNLISIEKDYRAGLVNYKKNLLNLFKSFNMNEKNIELTKNSINQKSRVIENKLSLEDYTKDSIIYKSDMAIVTSLKNTLTYYNTQKESLLMQYKNYTGQEFPGIDIVEEPVLTNLQNTNDSLTIQLAKLNLQIAQNKVDEENKAKERSYMRLSSTLSSNQNSYKISNGSYTNNYNSDYKGAIGVDYVADNLRLSSNLEIKTVYDSSVWDNSIKLGIGGKWTSDTKKSSDIIESKQNSNNLISKQRDLSKALLDYSYDKMTIQSDIDSWSFKYSQIKDEIRIAQENIELSKQMFELGLKSQDDVDESIFKLSQLKYDQLDVLIDGWITELSIVDIQL